MPHFPHTVDTVIIPMNGTNAFNQHGRHEGDERLSPRALDWR
ncbi:MULTISPECIES: hypothetical protein [unclassified Corynebacterium]|nr:MULTISPECIES: hypothetical protein [unclassified Corynebacterium]MDK8467028.1 hypothetical protein [Corynebacterium sp. MSK130]MDK8687777.1 hypothetical protein [Corynebacterium sp. MSK122]